VLCAFFVCFAVKLFLLMIFYFKFAPQKAPAFATTYAKASVVKESVG
jgi:hypothetical protein